MSKANRMKRERSALRGPRAPANDEVGDDCCPMCKALGQRITADGIEKIPGFVVDFGEVTARMYGL